MRQLSNKCVLNAPEIVIYTGVHGATTQQMRTALVEIVIYTGEHWKTTQQMRTERT